MMYVSRQMRRNALSSPVATGMPGLCSPAPFGKPTLRIVHPPEMHQECKECKECKALPR